MVQAHPKNAPGPFYVTADHCTACHVPVELAPDVFGWDDEEGSECGHCFVRDQPCTSEAVSRIIHAMKAAEVDCIRYRGSDRKIEAELDRHGLIHLCDEPSE